MPSPSPSRSACGRRSSHRTRPAPGEDPNAFPIDGAWDRITTFEDGYFQVPRPPVEPAGWRRSPEISGALLAAHGGIGYQHLDTCLPGTVFEIERHLPLVHEIVGPGTLAIGDTVGYRAYNELTVHDQVVFGNGTTGAVVDYTARFNVHVMGEFHAQHGAEAHLYNAQVWPDCSSSALRSITQINEPDESNSVCGRTVLDAELKLKFKMVCGDLSISPNPAYSSLLVTCTETQGTCIITDGQARTCLTWVPSQPLTVVDVTALAPGRYELQYQLGTCKSTKSFVIQR